MNKGTKIGLIASVAALGAGLMYTLCSGAEQPENDMNDTDQEQEAKKVYDEQPKDNTITGSNAMMKARLRSGYAVGEKDIRRFGTSQGIMDVSDDRLTRKKMKKRLAGMEKVGTALLKKSMPNIVKRKHKKHAKKHNDSHQLQVTVTNTSAEERTVRLWGGNKDTSVSRPLARDVEDHKIIARIEVPDTIGVGTHPQGVTVNPVNDFAYVTNQLSNNVTVIDASGQVVTIVQLQPSLLPGFNAPVAVAVNSNASSAHYGKVYVAGSVSNTVSVIDLSYHVTSEIPVGVRPVDIAFNPVNDHLYVVNLFDNTISVIDTSSESVVDTLNVGNDPMGVGINTGNGDIYVANSGSDSVTVFDRSNVPITTLTAVGARPVSAVYHPVNDEMYVVAANSNNVFPITAATHTLLAPVAVGSNPYKIVFNPNNNYLYVGNREDSTFTVIAPDKSVRATISKGNVNTGFAIGQAENQLWVTDTKANITHLVGYSDQSSNISVNNNYKRDVQHFTHSPVMISRIKLISSGEVRLGSAIYLTKETSGGAKNIQVVSCDNYKSPQNFLNVIEITDLEGTIVDGNTSWHFKAAGGQTVSIIVFFRQLQKVEILNYKF